jgi:hypothetical protein
LEWATRIELAFSAWEADIAKLVLPNKYLIKILISAEHLLLSEARALHGHYKVRRLESKGRTFTDRLSRLNFRTTLKVFFSRCVTRRSELVG